MRCVLNVFKGSLWTKNSCADGVLKSVGNILPNIVTLKSITQDYKNLRRSINHVSLMLMVEMDVYRKEAYKLIISIPQPGNFGLNISSTSVHMLVAY